MGARSYGAVMVMAMRRQATYRGATLAGVFTNSVFGIVLASILLTVYQERSDVRGLSASDAVTLTFFGQGMLLVVCMFGWRELAVRVREGSVAVDLLRPVDQTLYWGAMYTGSALFSALVRGVPPFVIGTLLFDVSTPSTPHRIIGSILTIVGATLVASRFWLIINVTTFWFVGEIRGLLQMSSIVVGVCAGNLLPLQFYPDWANVVLRRLPFAAMQQLPGEVFIGRQTMWSVLAAQAAWIGVLHGVCLWLMSRATRRLVIQGG